MHNDWSPEGFADAIAEIRRGLDLSMQDVARMAGVSRSQASRWSHGKHQPAYASVRRLAVAVRQRGRGVLADQLMKSAGYGALPEGEDSAPPGPLDDLKGDGWEEPWEEQVAADEGLAVDTRRWLITDSRAARVAHAARRQSRTGPSRRDRGREAG